jgi:hypothetical protein
VKFEFLSKLVIFPKQMYVNTACHVIVFSPGTLQSNKRKLKLCAAALLKAIDDFLVEYGEKNEIVEIHLVNNSNDVTDVLEEVFDEALGKNRKPSNRSSGEYKARGEFSSSDRKNHGQTGSGQGKSEGQSSCYKRSFSASGHIDTDVVTSGEGNRGHKEKGRGGKNDNDENDHYDSISNVSEGAEGGKNDSHDEDDHYESISDQVDPLKQETKPGNLNIIDN